MNIPSFRHRNLLFVLAAAMLGLLSACGGATPEPGTVAVSAVDFAFEDLPSTVAAGSTLTLTNNAETELHELVAIRLPDDENRSAADIVANPQDVVALFPNVETVLIAPPGEDGMPVVGTGTLTEPGRYLIICAIPTGADPDEYLAAAAESEGGPPDVPGGPPHFVNGMHAEITVNG